MHTRHADSKGRITLGETYAHRTLLVEERGDEIVLRLARVIPERESWLYANPDALGSVRRGLEQARSGAFAEEAPNLDRADDVAEQLRGE